MKLTVVRAAMLVAAVAVAMPHAEQSPLPDAANVRVYGPGDAFLGSAHVTGGELIAGRLLSPVEVAAAVPARPSLRLRIEEPESLSA